MFKPAVLKIVSYIALVCCLLGVLLTILELNITGKFTFYLIMLSWILLLYSSFLSIKLSSYELYEEDVKKLGYNVYGILILFILFLLLHISMGILPAGFIALRLHNQKKGMDAWMSEKNEV